MHRSVVLLVLGIVAERPLLIYFGAVVVTVVVVAD